jgi:hypothetical protein
MAVVAAGVAGGLFAAIGPLSHPWGANWRDAAFLGLTRGGGAGGVALVGFAVAWALATRLDLDRGGRGDPGGDRRMRRGP